MFSDKVKIRIKSGKGGDGHVSFRREKYVANGGPDGGDGGKGGDVIFVINKGLNNLSKYRHNKRYAAGAGQEGSKRRCHGKKGEDIILEVPEGTVIKEANSGQVIADMSNENDRCVVLEGGKGGLGNQHFATSKMQAPKYAQPGEDAIELEVILELKIIADVGLVGFPNAGKSTLLSRLSNAKPEIANYPFTTITPMLGVVDIGDGEGFVLADIPGLIEGASEGVGLGHEFLRHIERNRLLLHMVDAASIDGRDPIDAVNIINDELKSYSEKLSKKPQIIVANKIDALTNEEKESILNKLKSTFHTTVVAISGVTGEGLDELKAIVYDKLKDIPTGIEVFEPEYIVEKSFDNGPGYTIEIIDDEYVVEGPKIDKMLGFTNLETEKGFMFFQKFLKEQGILEELEKMGIEEGQTVRMYGHAFDFYR